MATYTISDVIIKYQKSEKIEQVENNKITYTGWNLKQLWNFTMSPIRQEQVRYEATTNN